MSNSANDNDKHDVDGKSGRRPKKQQSDNDDDEMSLEESKEIDGGNDEKKTTMTPRSESKAEENNVGAATTTTTTTTTMKSLPSDEKLPAFSAQDVEKEEKKKADFPRIYPFSHEHATTRTPRLATRAACVKNKNSEQDDNATGDNNRQEFSPSTENNEAKGSSHDRATAAFGVLGGKRPVATTGNLSNDAKHPVHEPTPPPRPQPVTTRGHNEGTSSTSATGLLNSPMPPQATQPGAVAVPGPNASDYEDDDDDFTITDPSTWTPPQPEEMEELRRRLREGLFPQAVEDNERGDDNIVAQAIDDNDRGDDNTLDTANSGS